MIAYLLPANFFQMSTEVRKKAVSSPAQICQKLSFVGLHRSNCCQQQDSHLISDQPGKEKAGESWMLRAKEESLSRARKSWLFTAGSKLIHTYIVLTAYVNDLLHKLIWN